MIFNKKKPQLIRLVISLYGNIIRAEFDSEEQARDERQRLHDKWKSVTRNRPNDPELTVYRLASNSGEVDFDLTQVKSIYLDAGRVSILRRESSS